jgi:hypothetical protein
MPPDGLQVFVVGLKITVLELPPPATSTRPSDKRVAVCPADLLGRLPAFVNRPTAAALHTVLAAGQ